MVYLFSRKLQWSVGLIGILAVLTLVLTIGGTAQAAEPRNLAWGCQGSDVVELQGQLNELGYNCGSTDGIFGPLTNSAVVALQKGNNLVQDGVVGPITRNCIFELKAKPESNRNLRQGCQGNDVAELQKQLKAKGFDCGSVDGIFGPRTHSAVINLQKANGLAVDGIVGPQTRASLVQSTSNPGSTTEPSRGSSTPNRYSKVITMKATAYCSCNKCNYPYGGQPSYIGLPLGQGIVAVDPKVIPMGTRLYVEGYGNAIAADQGNAIVGNRIDLCYPDHQSALKFGIKNIKVYVLP